MTDGKEGQTHDMADSCTVQIEQKDVRVPSGGKRCIVRDVLWLGTAWLKNFKLKTLQARTKTVTC